ncbi:dehydrogenase/reductase SDR family member 1-like [Amphiura filiformis]|uniref:dehydrogenase/reductase SDR family member 1-like n=1 Tax=Amphiura filiformis TaxID=82378 RepID=UPI003B21DED1
MSGSGPLSGRVCIVTGASRGIGKGIALQLGEAGATVYITGRTLKPNTDNNGVGGSLLETAEEIESRGGKCIPVQCDHSNDDEVEKLFNKVKTEQNGRLDILVNNAFSAGPALATNMRAELRWWEEDVDMWDVCNRVSLRGQYLAAVYAARLMVPAKQGLIINVSSAGGLMHFFSVPYSIGKSGSDRMASECSIDLKKHNIAYISLWPGPTRTEHVLKLQAEDSLEFPGDETKMLSRVIEIGETIEFSGKAVVCLASDPNIMKKTGKILHTAWIADEFRFHDVNGRHHLNPFCLKRMLLMTGHTWLASVMPEFVRIPSWFIAAMFHKFY